MNETNVKKLIDHLEGTPDSAFNMAFFWAKGCGCISGHAWQLFSGTFANNLGIDDDQAEELQCPFQVGAGWSSRPGQRDYISRSHAIAVLKNLLETNEVDWSIRA